MPDLLDELQKEADTARQRYRDAVGAFRAETEAALQAGANPIALYGLGIFQGPETDSSEAADYSRRSMRLLALRHEVDMTRTELDDALRRAQVERDEQRARNREEDARNREEDAREREKVAISIQRTIRTATVAYAFLTAAMLVTAAAQVYVTWRQTHIPPQAMPVPIVNIAAPSLPPTPAPVVNITIPLPATQPKKLR
jgi:hypothetical protein